MTQVQSLLPIKYHYLPCKNILHINAKHKASFVFWWLWLSIHHALIQTFTSVYQIIIANTIGIIKELFSHEVPILVYKSILKKLNDPQHWGLVYNMAN